MLAVILGLGIASEMYLLAYLLLCLHQVELFYAEMMCPQLLSELENVFLHPTG